MADKLTRDGLNKHLFGAADILRKRLDPPEYRPLIMTLLYIKRLSDTFEEKIDHLIKVEKRSEKEAYQKFRHTGAFVPEAARWKKVRKMQSGMGSKINKVCRAIEQENSPKLDDVLTNTKFDNRQKFPDDSMELLVSHFDTKNLGNNNLESPDIFGDAYEYLLAEFAGEIKTKGGQFYTPREVVGLLVKITNPQENMRICDPTCGSGGMLISTYNYVKNSGGDPDNLTLHGQDSNYTTVGMCKMNMVLHNVADFDIRHEDVLKTPLFVEGGNLLKYDKVLANFPFSENWQNASADSDRYHRFAYGIPPAKDKADFAFIQHMLTSLNDTSQAAIISPGWAVSRRWNSTTSPSSMRSSIMDCPFTRRANKESVFGIREVGRSMVSTASAVAESGNAINGSPAAMAPRTGMEIEPGAIAARSLLTSRSSMPREISGDRLM